MRDTDASVPPLRQTSILLSRLIISGGVLAALATCLGLFASAWWVFELASHYPLHYGMFAGLAAALTLCRRQWWLAALMLLFLGLNLAAILPLYGEILKPAHDISERLEILLANVNAGNRDPQRLLDYVHDERPDVLVLLEFTPDWEQALTVLASEYPHEFTETRTDAFGIQIRSRFPMQHKFLGYFSDSEVPSLQLDITVDGRTLRILGTHPLPPVSPGYATDRDQHLATLAQHVRGLSGHTVVLVGDLNCTPFSPTFKKLVEDSALLDSARGHGYQSTWPSRLVPFGIPIDHCLTTHPIVTRREIGPPIGSDHRPLLIGLSW